MHVNSTYASYGMYSAEARSRMLYLNPGTNYTPWLFLDGASMGSGYSNWENLILQRLANPSPLIKRIWGNYNPTTRTGTIYVRFINEGGLAFQGNVLFVITEDSIQRSTPNGDLWHNHVARDYIPDHIGTAVEVRDSVTVSYPFSISTSWVAERCEIVAIFQDINLVGSTREIWQGAKIKIIDLVMTGIEEEKNPPLPSFYKVITSPNPCVNKVNFSFTLPVGFEYQINLFDISGRNIRTLNGVASGKNEMVSCDFKNSVAPGVYFYRFESAISQETGKIVVK